MLPGSLALHLLLLAQRISLTLLLLHLLPHALTLGLNRNAGRCCSLLLDLLSAQILHLLSRVTITTSCLAS